MAKLCSPFGTSPVTSFFNELTTNSFSDEFHQIQPDPFDLFDDLPSICSDIQKIESDTFAQYCGGMDLDLDMKPEVRNTDLMWWTAPPTSVLSTSASSMSSDISSGVSLAAVMGASTTPPTSNLQIKLEKDEHHTPTIVTAKKINPMNFNNNTTIHVKQEPTDDVEQQLAYNSIPNKKSTVNATSPQLIGSTPTSSSMQNIPPGTSLLRKSQQQQQQQHKKSQQQIRGSLHITKRGDQLLPSANAINTSVSSENFTTNASTLFPTSNSPNTSLLYQRPDTPHSLDDDCSAPEFRHNVDLRACIMGSNNISLTTDQDFIKNVTEELQDTSKKQIDTRLAVGGCSLTDVLEVISSSPNSQDFLNLKNTSSALTPSTTCSSAFSYHSANTSGSMRSSESESDEESTMGSSSCSLLDHDITFNTGGVSPVSSQTSNIGSSQHYMQHRDHSYTRYKDDLSTNLETPSDSGESISFFILFYTNILYKCICTYICSILTQMFV